MIVGTSKNIQIADTEFVVLASSLLKVTYSGLELIYHNFGWDARRELMGTHGKNATWYYYIVIPHMQPHGAVKQINCMMIMIYESVLSVSLLLMYLSFTLSAVSYQCC